MTGESGVGVRRIGQIAITVRDLERARSFYREVLELEHGGAASRGWIIAVSCGRYGGPMRSVHRPGDSMALAR
jgi:predicted enzyme related to lactoylglutathione lyase